MLSRIRSQGILFFRWGFLLCLLLSVGFCGLRYGWRTRFSAMGTRFTLTRLSSTEAAARDSDGMEAVLTGPRDLLMDGGFQSLVYRGETIRRFCSDGMEIFFEFPDGTVLSEKSLGEPDSVHGGEYLLIRRLAGLYEGLSPLKRLFIALPTSLFVLFIGLLMLCFPERNWEVTHFLCTEGGSPTRLALESIQDIGAALIIAGLLVALLF